MSRMLGTQLPQDIVTRLDGMDLAAKVGPSIFLLSSDDGGYPHVALLSYGEVLARSPGEVRVLIWAVGSAARNLAARHVACIGLVEPGLVIYIKGNARPLGPAPLPGAIALVGFALDVTRVLADEEAGTEMVTAATYRWTERTPEQLVARWREQLASLRAL